LASSVASSRFLLRLLREIRHICDMLLHVLLFGTPANIQHRSALAGYTTATMPLQNVWLCVIWRCLNARHAHVPATAVAAAASASLPAGDSYESCYMLGILFRTP
jgi:hypothetical protein